MRAIDADDLMKTVKRLEHMNGEYTESFVNSAGNRSIEFDRLKDYIDNAQTIDIPKRMIAHWVWNPNGNDYGIPAWTCSNCNCKNDMLPTFGVKYGEALKNPYLFAGSNFCPNCGAQMIKEETNEN